MNTSNKILISATTGLDALQLALSNNSVGDFYVSSLCRMITGAALKAILETMDNRSKSYSTCYQRPDFIEQVFEANPITQTTDVASVVSNIETALWNTVMDFAKKTSYMGETGYGVFMLNELPQYRMFSIEFVGDYRVMEWMSDSSELELSCEISELDVVRNEALSKLNIITTRCKEYRLSGGDTNISLIDALYRIVRNDDDLPKPKFDNFFDLLGRQLSVDDIEWCSSTGIHEITAWSAIHAINDLKTLEDILEFLTYISDSIYWDVRELSL